MTPIESEVYGLCVMILAGVAVGLVIDSGRSVRTEFRPGLTMTAIIDFVIWSIITALVFGALLLASWGEVRLYCVLGLGCGWFLYRAMASLVVLNALTLLMKASHNCVAGAIRRIGQCQAWGKRN